MKQQELLVPHSSWHKDARPTSRVKCLNASVLLSSTPLPFCHLPTPYSRATCLHPAINVAGEGENIEAIQRRRCSSTCEEEFEELDATSSKCRDAASSKCRDAAFLQLPSPQPSAVAASPSSSDVNTPPPPSRASCKNRLLPTQAGHCVR